MPGSSSCCRSRSPSQRRYLEHFRGLVRPAVAPESAEGSAVTSAEETSIVAELERAYPGYPPVADLPSLVPENIKAVARELSAAEARPHDLLAPVRAYVDAVNAGNLDALAGVFAADAEVVDVGWRFTGRPAIRDWAEKEVIGGTLAVSGVVESRPGYQRLLVRFAPGGTGGLDAHYGFTVAGASITRAELTYAG